MTPGDAARRLIPARAPDHAFGEIQAHDQAPGPRLFRGGDGQRTRSAGDVEHPHAGPTALERPRAQASVLAQPYQPREQIVAVRERIEHAADVGMVGPGRPLEVQKAHVGKMWAKSSARLSTPALPKICVAYCLTVLSEMPDTRAISPFESPFRMSRAMSSSRSVSPSRTSPRSTKCWREAGGSAALSITRRSSA